MSIFAATIPAFAQMLEALDGFLEKGEHHVLAQGGDANALLQARLAPDMHPLASQVQFSCTQAMEAVTRLSGQALLPVDAPTDFAQARALIQRARKALHEADRLAIDDAPERPLTITLPGDLVFEMSKEQYVVNWVVPQFYFHLVTAYDILRSQGVALGKADYVRHMFAFRKVPGE